MDLRAILQNLGLKDKEAACYLDLLTLGGTATASELARIAGLKRTSVYDVMNALHMQGFVVFANKGSKRTFTATRPSAVLTMWNERVLALQSAIFAFEALSGLTHDQPRVTVLQGKEQIQAALSGCVRS